MPIANQYGGGLIVLGALLNLTRMLPIYVNEEINLHNIPPVTVEQITATSLLPGWLLSHMMGFFSAPLLIVGLIVFYRALPSQRQSYAWLCSLVALCMGMLFYALAVGIDGVVLPQAAQQLTAAASPVQITTAAMLQTTVHSFAVGMGGLSLAVTLAGVAILGFGLLKYSSSHMLGWAGVLFGCLGGLAMTMGVVDIHMHNNFKLSAGVLFGAQAWLLWLGIGVFRGVQVRE